MANEQRPEQGNAMIVQPWRADAFHLFRHDDLLFGRKAHAAIFARPTRCQPAFIGKSLVPRPILFQVKSQRRVAQMRRAIRLDPCPDHGTERIVIQRVHVIGQRSLGHRPTPSSA